jgi:hypothetical protein
MTAVEHDKFQQKRTMVIWSEDQEFDHHRQMRIANFIMSLAKVSSELANLRNRFMLNYGYQNSPPNMTDEAFHAKQAMDEIESMIRRHSIRTFGEDIFMPGKLEDLPHHSSQQKEQNHGKV